jgi:hypothetical protein
MCISMVTAARDRLLVHVTATCRQSFGRGRQDPADARRSMTAAWQWLPDDGTTRPCADGDRSDRLDKQIDVDVPLGRAGDHDPGQARPSDTSTEVGSATDLPGLNPNDRGRPRGLSKQHPRKSAHCPKTTVLQTLHADGVVRPRERITERQIRDASRLIRGGLSVNKAAAKRGVSNSTLRYQLKRRGPPTQPG